MELLSQNPEISLDEETKGFDLSAGSTWVYPENYPVREYQFSIVKTALYNNTFVCLPTGLGKTFIAAVVMYNFWRWYPRGKVVFLAPTRPLVAQQINACHNVMGISPTETVELTGSVNQKNREVAWFKKRVIFATPQVFQNDLEKGIVPADLIKCVVIDEGHKALGKHSYCECIRILKGKNKYFRVLALSATPGNKIDDVHEVVSNLLITSLEIRDEHSPDIVPYTNERQVKVIVVDLSRDLARFKDRYVSIMDRHVKLLVRHNVLQGNTGTISKGRIFYLVKDYQRRTNRSGNYGQIMKTLTILLTMYHAYDLLIRNGLRTFLYFYQTHSDKVWMNDESALQNLLDDLEEYLGPFPKLIDIQGPRPPEIPQDLKFGHKKFDKLKDVLLNHFSTNSPTEKDSRAIVFVEYKDTVSEVYVLLLQLRPLIRPQMFVGQARQKQKQQLKALQDFRNNRVNVLISTSIGEEGLDVGEVDLIVCFDITQGSPIRLVQRMGRTGRKRDGQIIVLVTEGKEHEALRSTLSKRDSINNKILNTSSVFGFLYQENPRMVPKPLKPECHRIHIMIEPKEAIEKKRGKRETKKAGKTKEKGQPKITKSFVSESSVSEIKTTQYSIDKFFKANVCNENGEMNSESATPPRKKNKDDITRTLIDPSEVKLLTSDSDAVEFLTLCTLRKSTYEEIVSERSIYLRYTYRQSPKKDYFDFPICDEQALNCLLSLPENLPDVPPPVENDDIEFQDKAEQFSMGDTAFADESSFTYFDEAYNQISDRSARDIVIESRLEDLLDESSESDHNVQVVSPKTSNCDIMNINRSPTSHISSESKQCKPCDLEQSVFEALLDESSDSTSDAKSDFIKDIDFDDNDLQFTAITTHAAPDKTTAQCLEIKEQIASRQAGPQNNVACNSEIKQTNVTTRLSTSRNDDMLSVTQAISEIGRINSVLQTSATFFESEDDMFDVDEADCIKDNESKIHQHCIIKSSDTPIVNNKPEERSIYDLSTEPEGSTSIEAQDEVESDFSLNDSDWYVAVKDIEKSEQAAIEKQIISTPITKEPNSSMHNIQTPSVTCPKNENGFLDDGDWIDVLANVENFEQSRNVKRMVSTPVTTPVTKKTECSLRDFRTPPVVQSREQKKDNTPQLGLVKKLASLPKPSNSYTFEQLLSDSDDFDVFDVKDEEMNELTVSSRFFNTLSSGAAHNASKSNTSTIGSTDTSAETASKTGDLSVFKAPAKYVKRKAATFNSPRGISEPRSIVPRDNKALQDKVTNGRNTWRRKARRKGRNEFICDEAEVSTDSGQSADETSETEGDDDLVDFVSHTQSDHNTTEMHAHYLQSIRSPVKRSAGFVFKALRTPKQEIEIYSQPVAEMHDSYVNDSFCVTNDEDDDCVIIGESSSYDLLEIAERKLKESRKRGREKSAQSSVRPKKWRRIVRDASSSSGDEAG